MTTIDATKEHAAYGRVNENVKSFRGLCDESNNSRINNWFSNVGISYFDSFIEHGCKFHAYIYDINNNKYISDLEYKYLYDRYTKDHDNHLNKNHLNEAGVFDCNVNNSSMTIDKGILLKNNYTNAGHSFGNLTNQIYHIKQQFGDTNDFKIIIPEHLANSIFFYSLMLIFFNEDQIFVLSPKTIIKCNNLYIMKDDSHHHHLPIKFLLENLSLKLPTELSTQTYKNIFLIKSSITENFSPARAFSCEYNEYFIAKGFNHIIPEKYDILELFRIINNAENVVLSWGCVSYLNGIFCSDKSKRLIIGHESYSHEYNQFNELTMIPAGFIGYLPTLPGFIGDLPTNMDDKTSSLLDEKIKDHLLL